MSSSLVSPMARLAVLLLFTGGALQAADVKLAWDANTEPALAGYKVYYGTASRTYGASIQVGKVTTYTVTNLGPGTWYFAVTAYDSAGRETSYSNEVSEVVQSVPAAPANLAPANGTMGVPLMPTLTWSASAGATSYDVYFGTGATPPLAVNTASTGYAPPVQPLTTYYWRVVAKNSAGFASSATISFTTIPAAPSVPTGLNPGNGATGVSRTVMLAWSPAAGAASYDVYLGTSNPPVLVGSVTGTTYAPAMLGASATYYWRVVANNAGGSTSSSVVSFTTTSGAPSNPTGLRIGP